MSGCHCPELDEKHPYTIAYLTSKLQDMEKKLDMLAQCHVKLKREFELKLNVDMDKWKEYFSSIPLNNKKPHKCPVCDGSGRYRLATAQRLDDVIDCRSCEGKGIVWG